MGAAVIWGGSYPAVKAVQAAIPPVPLAAFRCGAAALVLLAAGFVTPAGAPRSERRDWIPAALLGLAGNTAFQLCLIGGLRDTSPAHSALIVSLSPIVTALLGRLWLGEPVGRRRQLGILVSFGGVALLVSQRGGTAPGNVFRGDVLSFGAAVAWAVYSVGGKRLLARQPALSLTTIAMVAGALPLLVAGMPALRGIAWAALPPGTWLLLLYVSLVALALNNILFSWALARTAIAHAAAFQFVTPLTALLLSAVLGQQRVTSILLVSAATILGGVALAQRG